MFIYLTLEYSDCRTVAVRSQKAVMGSGSPSQLLKTRELQFCNKVYSHNGAYGRKNPNMFTAWKSSSLLQSLTYKTQGTEWHPLQTVIGLSHNVIFMTQLIYTKSLSLWMWYGTACLALHMHKNTLILAQI